MFAPIAAVSGWWYPLVIVSLCNVAAAGTILWYAWKGRHARASSPQLPSPPLTRQTRLDADEVHEVLQRLKELTASTAHDVGEHSTRVQNVTEQISASSPGDDDALRASLLASRAQLLEANQKLQAELARTKSDLQEHAKRIEVYMTEARTDALAGVANRRALDEELARRYAAWQRQETPFSLLIIDADHFKKFNDTHGHQAGDAVLRNMGRVLAATARDMDFVARYGGEEFALVLPGTEVDEAKSAAERIRKAVAQMKLAFAGKKLEVTVSVGVAELRPGDTVTSLTQHADTALYAAKTNGRNCSYYYERGACLPVDPGAAAGRAEAAGGVRPQLVEVAPENGPADRRIQPRHSFARVQRIAPYVAGRVPAAEEFHEVQCRDLSSTGISFWMLSPPQFSSLVLALGGGDAVKYLIAEVMRTVPVRHDDKTIYIVGCRFTGRLDLDGAPPPTPATAGLSPEGAE